MYWTRSRVLHLFPEEMEICNPFSVIQHLNTFLKNPERAKKTQKHVFLTHVCTLQLVLKPRKFKSKRFCCFVGNNIREGSFLFPRGLCDASKVNVRDGGETGQNGGQTRSWCFSSCFRTFYWLLLNLTNNIMFLKTFRIKSNTTIRGSDRYVYSFSYPFFRFEMKNI